MGTNQVDVCLVTKHFYPFLSGAGERFRRYAPGLRARGSHLRVFTLQRDGVPASETIDGIPVQRVSADVDPREMTTLLLRKAMNHFRETGQWPDVLHFLHCSVEGIPYVWYARLLGIPCLFSVTMIPTELKAQERWLKVLISGWLTFRPFNCVIASSTVVMQRLIRQGVSARRIEIIPNGVDISRFRPTTWPRERNEIRRQLGLAPDDEVILFVGHISRRKGVDLLIDAWPQIIRRRPQARLLLVGQRCRYQKTSPRDLYDSAFSDKMDQAIASALFERVVFTGEVSNVEAYMQAADVFVFPSRREGMGNVVAEAMATGLPCVLTPYEGLPAEFGEHGREFLLVSHDSDALAATVLEMLESEERCKKIGLAARSWVERHLDVEASLDRYAEIYRGLL